MFMHFSLYVLFVKAATDSLSNRIQVEMKRFPTDDLTKELGEAQLYWWPGGLEVVEGLEVSRKCAVSEPQMALLQ